MLDAMRGLLAIAFLAAAAAAQDDAATRLGADDPAVRAAAAAELGGKGPQSAPAVPRLIELLYDDLDAPRKAAIVALGRIGPAARPAGPFLADLVALRGDFAPLVAQAQARIGAPPDPPLLDWLRGKGALPADARTLDDLAKHATALQPRLLEALADEHSLVVAQAARLLAPAARSGNPVLAAVAQLLDDPSACVRLHAAIALSHNPLATEVFASMLLDPRVARRRLAARFLRGPAATQHLRRALTDADPEVRAGAAAGFSVTDLRDDPSLVIGIAEVLERDPALAPYFSTVFAMLGPAGAPAVPAFLRCLADADDGVRGAACDALGRMRAGAATGALAAAAYDEQQGVALAALRALASIGPAAKEAAPIVAELAEADLSLGPQARATLAAIGEGAPLPPAPDASELPVLRAALADADGIAAGRAAFAIGRLAPQDAETVDALGAALEHGSPYARRHAALALRRIGPKGLPAVARAATEGTPRTRRLAAAAFVPFASVAPDEFLPVGIALLTADDPYVRAEAIRALGVVGPRARDAVPAMVASLAAADRHLAQAAIWALGQMRSAASGAVPHLVEVMETTGDPTETWMAILSLGEIGLAAEPAVPSIVAVGRRRNPGPELFSPAVEALVRIGPAGHAALVALIREERGVNRQLPINALARLGLNPPGFKEALDEVVKDADAQTREIALMAIRALGPDSKPTTESLVAVLRSGTLDTRSRQGVVQGLAETATIAELLDLARDKDPRVVAGAWLALSCKDPAKLTDAERDRAYPMLLAALGDGRAETALAAAAALRCVPLRAPDPQVLLLLGRHGDARTEIAAAIRALGANAVPALAKALAAKDRDVRVGAALALAQFGPDARPAVPALRDAALREKGNATPFVRAILQTSDLAVVADMLREAPPFRRSFADALARAGAAAVPHVDRLRRDDDPDVRREALLLAPQLGEAAIPWLLAGAEDPATAVADAAVAGLGGDLVPPVQAIPALARACRRAEIRPAALRALAKRGPAALPAIREFASDPDPRVRAQALSVLGKDGVELLAAALADGDANVRRTAAMALRDCRAAALPALPGLRRLLGDPQMEVRGAAASALAAIGPAAVKPLVEVLKTTDPRARESAVYALREIGPGAADALPALRDLEDDPDPAVRRATALAFGALGPAALDPLVGMCRDKDASVRAAAAGALRLLREAAAPALPTLRALLRDPDDWVRIAAAKTVGTLGKDAEMAIPELADLLRRGSEPHRAAAAEALLSIGPAAAPALARAATDPVKETRDAAGDALGKLGADAVPAVVALVDPEDERVLRATAEALARIGPPAVPALTGLLGHASAAVRRDAAWALGTIGAPAREAVPSLVAALDDKDRTVPPQAAWALGQIGPAAAEALPALEKMHKARRHPAIVADAIRRIRGS